MKKIIIYSIVLISLFGFKKAFEPKGEYSEVIPPSVKAYLGASSIGISSIYYMEAKGAKFTSLEYETDNGAKSYILYVITGDTPIMAGGEPLLANKEYIVDCTGTCDCRERFIPSTGAIECTCSPCEMKITEIEGQG